MSRRLCLVPGGTTISESERNSALDAFLKKPKVLSAFLRWCQEGAAMVFEDLRFDVCKQHATDSVSTEFSNFWDFLEDTEYGRIQRPVRTKECFETYMEWCESRGRLPIGKHSFRPLMERYGYVVVKKQGIEYYEPLTLPN